MTAADAWDKYRRRLRKAIKQQDENEILAVCSEFEQYCETAGWPDYWTDFERAKQDVALAMVYR